MQRSESGWTATPSINASASDCLEVSSKQAARVCLLILGMHRSGTSAVCGVMHQLGAERPLREMPPQPDNEKGFFEPIVLSAIHDRMLGSAGLYWFDWEPMPRSWFKSDAYDAFLGELVEAATVDFPGRGPFMLKDPRICRFVDVWLAALERLTAKPVVIFQYRHPIEVARSLKVRDGLPIAHGLLTWLRHVIDAEKATRDVERSFVSFNGLLLDWQAELAPILQNDQVNFPKTSARALTLAGDFLDSSLRHQVKSSNQAEESLHDWFRESFDALEQLRVDPYSQEAMATLDAVRDDFDAASAAFSPVFHQLLLQVDQFGRIARQTGEIETALVASQQALVAATPALERLPFVEAELEAVRRYAIGIQASADRVPSLEAEREHLRMTLMSFRSLADRVPSLEAELVDMRQAHSIMEQRASAVPNLEEVLASTAQDLAAVQGLADRVPRLEADLAASMRSVDELRDALDAARMKASKTIGHRLSAALSLVRRKGN